MDGSDYNWDAPSKLYIVNGEKDSPCHPGVHIDDAAGTKPETYDDVKAFINTHGLNHGDLVRFGYHRDTDTVIVSRVPDTGRMGFTRNPDDSGAGYLTIPAEVLANVRNGPRKYADIISSGTPTINLHLGANDEFITGTLGGQPEEGCQFDVLYIAGALESISVKLPGSTRWHEFLPDDLTLKRLTRLLEVHNRAEGDEDNARLTLRVSLRGEQLTRYKDKYSRPAHKYAWLQAVPELPEGWSIEKGMSAGGSTSASWVWKLHGPARELPQVRREVGEFLRGFDFEYTDDAQTL